VSSGCFSTTAGRQHVEAFLVFGAVFIEGMDRVSCNSVTLTGVFVDVKLIIFSRSSR
jgi:hypothetical protein